MVNPKWHYKFNGGNPVWLDENDTIVRHLTLSEIYEILDEEGKRYMYNHLTDEEKKEIDDLCSEC